MDERQGDLRTASCIDLNLMSSERHMLLTAVRSRLQFAYHWKTSWPCNKLNFFRWRDAASRGSLLSACFKDGNDAASHGRVGNVARWD